MRFSRNIPYHCVWYSAFITDSEIFLETLFSVYSFNAAQGGRYTKRQLFHLPGDVTKMVKIRTCTVSWLYLAQCPLASNGPPPPPPPLWIMCPRHYTYSGLLHGTFDIQVEIMILREIAVEYMYNCAHNIAFMRCFHRRLKRACKHQSNPSIQHMTAGMWLKMML